MDLFTSYYTDLEPDSCLVAETLEAEGRPQVVGYLLGCTSTKRYRSYQPLLLSRIACRVLRGLLRGEFNAAARSYLWWTIRRGWQEMPRTPAGGAHFHFNFIKEWRNRTALHLVETYLALLRREYPELPVVWGQMTTYGKRRTEAAFRRYGWKFYDRVRLTKYDGISRTWHQEGSVWSQQDVPGQCPNSYKYTRYQLPEIYLTTIYHEL